MVPSLHLQPYFASASSQWLWCVCTFCMLSPAYVTQQCESTKSCADSFIFHISKWCLPKSNNLNGTIQQKVPVQKVKLMINHHTQGCGNTVPDLSDLVPFHSGQVRNLYFTCQFYTSNRINYFKLACCLENSVDADQLASEEAS